MILANMNQFFDLDDHHRFFTDEPLAVCGNSCAMVQDICYDKAFRIEGDRSVHYGPFPGCGNIPCAADGEGAGSCCCGGGCCWKLLLGPSCVQAGAIALRSLRRRRGHVAACVSGGDEARGGSLHRFPCD